ncbi:hypothetical protein H0E87_005425 [Populus deltoides]|uniref:Uncharacterized protein n=1 Tax=Populus deltoides TaxID=3696 RepID=A0A8T2ZJB1_POPDE|nr:hypothetical protein H0E87_005425 [Populus deltoides]
MGILEMEEENLEECWLNHAICHRMFQCYTKYVKVILQQSAEALSFSYREWKTRFAESKPFAVSSAKYVMKVSEVSSRLSTAVESVQFEMFFCSLLESQRLVLRPSLIEHIHPCLEEVLDQIHVDHFKKVFFISQQLMLGFRIDIFCQLLFYGCWATNRILPAHQQP